MMNQSKININSNWSCISDHHYQIRIIVGLGSCETNVLLKLVKAQPPYIDKNYLYAKDPLESKY